jgi:hypothetical protein
LVASVGSDRRDLHRHAAPDEEELKSRWHSSTTNIARSRHVILGTEFAGEWRAFPSASAHRARPAQVDRQDVSQAGRLRHRVIERPLEAACVAALVAYSRSEHRCGPNLHDSERSHFVTRESYRSGTGPLSGSAGNTSDVTIRGHTAPTSRLRASACRERRLLHTGSTVATTSAFRIAAVTIVIVKRHPVLTPGRHLELTPWFKSTSPTPSPRSVAG